MGLGGACPREGRWGEVGQHSEEYSLWSLAIGVWPVSAREPSAVGSDEPRGRSEAGGLCGVHKTRGYKVTQGQGALSHDLGRTKPLEVAAQGITATSFLMCNCCVQSWPDPGTEVHRDPPGPLVQEGAGGPGQCHRRGRGLRASRRSGAVLLSSGAGGGAVGLNTGMYLIGRV